MSAARAALEPSIGVAQEHHGVGGDVYVGQVRPVALDGDGAVVHVVGPVAVAA